MGKTPNQIISLESAVADGPDPYCPVHFMGAHMCIIFKVLRKNNYFTLKTRGCYLKIGGCYLKILNPGPPYRHPSLTPHFPYGAIARNAAHRCLTVKFLNWGVRGGAGVSSTLLPVRPVPPSSEPPPNPPTPPPGFASY